VFYGGRESERRCKKSWSTGVSSEYRFTPRTRNNFWGINSKKGVVSAPPRARKHPLPEGEKRFSG